MSHIDTRAEITKLSRLLGTKAEQLSYLEVVSPAALIQFRNGLTERFFAGNRKMFQRVAASSRLLPTALNATISQKVFGPMLSARIAGELPFKSAIDMASKLPTPFLADVTLEIDPSRAKDIIRNMPINRIVEVALELLRRKEFILMARFVDYMTDEANRACINAFKEESVLLELGKYMESKGRIKDVMRMLPPDRMKKLVKAASASPQMMDDTLLLLQYLDAPLKKQIVTLIKENSATQPEGMLAKLAPENLAALLEAFASVPGMADDANQILASLTASARKQVQAVLKGLDSKQLTLFKF